jgi:hypothetical protein
MLFVISITSLLVVEGLSRVIMDARREGIISGIKRDAMKY